MNRKQTHTRWIIRNLSCLTVRVEKSGFDIIRLTTQYDMFPPPHFPFNGMFISTVNRVWISITPLASIYNIHGILCWIEYSWNYWERFFVLFFYTYLWFVCRIPTMTSPTGYMIPARYILRINNWFWFENVCRSEILRCGRWHCHFLWHYREGTETK